MMQTHNRNAILQLLNPNRTGRALLLDWQDSIAFSRLTDLAIAWWDDYKTFEREDTVEAAYREQRLTVKGGDPKWSKDVAFKKDPAKAALEVFKDASGGTYPLLKGVKGMQMRCDPSNFLPMKGGTSRKTELGLHDMSTGLMSATKPISEQQYKMLGKGGDNADTQIYTFMPLGYPEDQHVFQLLNDLAKRVRNDRPAFYGMVRMFRSQMTRIKLAAEHDMSTNFSLAPHAGYKTVDGKQVPKFRFSLLSKTDVTAQDAPLLDAEGRQQLATALSQNKKMPLVKTSPELLHARQQAALNYQQLVLDKMRYGEVVVAFRHHAGQFPLFTKYVGDDTFVVGGLYGKTWAAHDPLQAICLKPSPK